MTTTSGRFLAVILGLLAPLDQTTATSESLVGRVLAGRYRITAPLGRGGAGNVFLAVQEPLGREVAVKVLRTDIAEGALKEFESRFLREAALAGRLSHPNVVTVHDFGTTEDGMRYVAMEALKGQTLRDAMRRGPMEPRRAVRVAIGVARGLRHAHQAGLVHRDIKPTNVFLVKGDGGEERPVVLDFGLVKASDHEDSLVTKVGTYMGTPAYMAPEQAMGNGDVDGRTDLYALGCVLYRMLTGVLPYSSDNPLSLALKHQTEPYPPMTGRVDGTAVDADLEAIVERVLSKNPDDRYADADAFALALEEWLAGGESLVAAAPPASAGSMVGVGVGAGVAAFGLLGGLGIALAAIVVAIGVAGGGLLLGSPAPSVSVEPFEEAEVVGDASEDGADEEVEGDVGDEPGGAEGADGVVGLDVEARDPPRRSKGSKRKAPAPTEAPAAAAPVPAGSAAAASRPAPAPAAAPSRPAPAPAPAASRPAAAPVASGSAVTVDGVAFDAGHAKRALVWLNSAPEAQVRAAGIAGRQVNIILNGRPFASVAAFGSTPYIGPKTVQSVANATR